MAVVTVSLLIALFIGNVTAKPTFDVIADIIHDLVHDPNLPANYGPPQYVPNAAHTQNGYNRPDYGHGGYGYNQILHQTGSGAVYPNNSPNGYYPNKRPYGVYYPTTGTDNYYGPNVVYDNQGYYKGPPYATHQRNDYNYNKGRNYGLRGY